MIDVCGHQAGVPVGGEGRETREESLAVAEVLSCLL